MKKAYISLMGGLPWGGSEVYWSNAAIKDLENGVEVFVSVYDWGKETHPTIHELRNRGAKIHLRERFSHDVPLAKKIKRFIQKRIPQLNTSWNELIHFYPDEVLINQGGNTEFVVFHYDLFRELSRKSIPYSIVCHSHEQFSFLPGENIYPRGIDVFNEAKNVFFVSSRQKKLTERMLCIPLTNGSIFKNPLNLDQHEYLRYPKNDNTQFAIVGALVSGKGHDTLFEVLSQSQWKARHWKLNIYGKGYGLPYLKDLAKYFDIEDRIHFHGHVSSATEIWKKNHVLLIPSDGEGLPISLVEAAISGRTAIVTDVGGNTEIIKDNENGFAACAPTPHSFSEALERAWKRKEEWEYMGKKLSQLDITNQ